MPRGNRQNRRVGTSRQRLRRLPGQFQCLDEKCLDVGSPFDVGSADSGPGRQCEVAQGGDLRTRLEVLDRDFSSFDPALIPRAAGQVFREHAILAGELIDDSSGVGDVQFMPDLLSGGGIRSGVQFGCLGSPDPLFADHALNFAPKFSETDPNSPSFTS